MCDYGLESVASRPAKAGSCRVLYGPDLPHRPQMRTTQPITSVRTGSESGRPAPSPRSRSPSVAQCDTRSTAVVLATAR